VIRSIVVLALAGLAALGAGYEWGGPAARALRELRAGKPREAIAAFDEARRERPALGALRYDQALAFQAAGEPDSARGAYREALEMEGNAARASAAFNLGNEALREGRLEEAIAGYRASLRNDPSRGDAKRNLEEALRRARASSARRQSGASGTQGDGSGGSGRREGGAEPPPPDGPSGPQEQPASSDPGPKRNLGAETPNRDEAEHWLDALEAERRASRSQEQAGRRAARSERRARDW
jgi:tetratricopeptide (TPR) repeat protein